MVVMTKNQKNTLATLLILLLLYYVFVYTKTMAKTKSNGNGNGGQGSVPPEKKYICDAGGCLACDDNNTHPSCVSLAKCQEQCSSQVQIPVQVAQNDVIGCMDDTQINYDANANVPCNNCCVPAIMGCNDPSALNHYPAVSQGFGCNRDPNNRSCCVYMGTNGQTYYGS